MRKAELDHLLLTAVAHAIGQPAPKRRKTQRGAAKRTATQRYRAAVADHHAHI
jgi:hypothetical protein